MFSKTAMAGAPIRIAQAINEHTEVQVRLVDSKRWGIFEHDHIHEENPEITFSLAQEADIIHLFNYLDGRSEDFAPVDFSDLEKRGKRLVRHFESTPMLVADAMGIPLEGVLNDPIPKLVIAQYPERFLPTARVVPNIIPQDDPAYQPSEGEHEEMGMIFSPSWQRSAWDARWDTKGLPETVELIGKVALRTGWRFQVLQNMPLAEVLREKRKAAIIIDELITGSYHLSGLEGLSLGKPVLAFLDERTQYVLREISGSQSCPFVNVRLEDGYEVLIHLLENHLERRKLGQENREWIEKHWSDRSLVQHFVEVYEQLLTDPSQVKRQPELALDSACSRFVAINLADRIYQARARRWFESEPLKRRLWRLLSPQVTELKRRVADFMPEPIKAVLLKACSWLRSSTS